MDVRMAAEPGAPTRRPTSRKTARSNQLKRTPELEPVYELAESCLYEVGHAHQVTRLALMLFDELVDRHGLGPKRRFRLTCAGLLHDIGWIEGGSGHHKASLRLILESPVLPWDDRQRLIIGSIARYHRKAVPARTHEHYMQLRRPERREVRLLAGMLRVADGLDRSHRSAVRKLDCAFDDQDIHIHAHVSRPAELECEAALRKADLMVEAFDRNVGIDWSIEPA